MPDCRTANQKNIILTGFMGTGKTSVGRVVAERLGWTFVDLDERISIAAGKPVPAIFAEDG
jgi:shikimate kinase